MMQFAHKHIHNVSGLSFYKLMGTGGGNGFQWNPDFSTYCLLGVWRDNEQAKLFFHQAPIYLAYQERATEIFTVWLYPVFASGSWTGQQPFECRPYDKRLAVAILTRAQIKLKHVQAFWRKVPPVSDSISLHGGKLFSKGIGEWPIIHQATFSIWQDIASMRAYAYQNEKHKEVIRLTRQYGWYKEEMFARFQPFHVEGTWQGVNPLVSYLPHTTTSSISLSL